MMMNRQNSDSYFKYGIIFNIYFFDLSFTTEYSF